MKGENLMRTKEELNALKEEVVTLNEKLHELTEEELAQVTGGVDPVFNGKQLELESHDPTLWRI